MDDTIRSGDNGTGEHIFVFIQSEHEKHEQFQLRYKQHVDQFCI